MLDTEESVTITQERLSIEGRNLGELIQHFRDRISTTLIGESQWQRILECAQSLPVEMGAQPFGFEIPLHKLDPVADFGASLSIDTKSAEIFLERAPVESSGSLATTIACLAQQLEQNESSLREIVGRKLMFEFDVSSSNFRAGTYSGMFLRPNEKPITGCSGQTREVHSIVDALVSCAGWEHNAFERRNVERAYLAQPPNTRMDSFGVFPSRSRFIRLAVMGFKTIPEVQDYLTKADWPGDIKEVKSVISRFARRTSVERTGLNVDVLDSGLGPTLGLTLIVKQRYTKQSRYWLDGLTDWQPFLRALEGEEVIIPEKIHSLEPWVTSPTILYGKSGRFVLMQGIHHIKIVMNLEKLHSAKAYLFLVLAAAPQANSS